MASPSNHKAFDSSELVLLLRNKQERGLAELYQRYSGAILHLISRIIPEKSLAEEVLQDTFVKVWDKIDLFDSEKGRLFTWMAQIARNTSLDRVRLAGYQNQKKTDGLDSLVHEGDGGKTELVLADSGMAKVIQSLPQDKVQLIELLYFQGYSQSEAAEKLEIPLGTVKTRIRSAIMELRKILGNESELLAILISTIELL